MSDSETIYWECQALKDAGLPSVMSHWDGVEFLKPDFEIAEIEGANTLMMQRGWSKAASQGRYSSDGSAGSQQWLVEQALWMKNRVNAKSWAAMCEKNEAAREHLLVEAA